MKEQIKAFLLKVASADKEKCREDRNYIKQASRLFVWACLQALYERQEEGEKMAHATVVRNGVGFNGTDATFLSDVAEKTATRFDLSSGQARAVAKCLAKYSGQLAEESARIAGLKARYEELAGKKSETAPAAPAAASKGQETAPAATRKEYDPTKGQRIGGTLQNGRYSRTTIDAFGRESKVSKAKQKEADKDALHAELLASESAFLRMAAAYPCANVG